MGEQLTPRGQLVGHNGWVTAIATTIEDPNLVLSASRDKTIIVWQLTRTEQNYGFAARSLQGHSHCTLALHRVLLAGQPKLAFSLRGISI